MKKGILVAITMFVSAMILFSGQGNVQAGTKKKAAATPTLKPIWEGKLVYDEIDLKKNPWQGAYDQWEKDNFWHHNNPNWVDGFWDDIANIRISGNYKYRILSDTEKTAAIWEVINEKKKMIIPDYIEGYKIIGIGGEAFYEEDVLGKKDGKYYYGGNVVAGDTVEEVVLPKGIKYIGAGAFCGCRSLKKINLDVVEKRIDHHAFQECDSLKKVSIPPKVTIENQAFYKCSALKQVTFSEGVLTRTDCFKKCENLEEMVCNSNDVYFAAFGNSSSIESIVLDPAQKDTFTLCKMAFFSVDKVKTGKNVSVLYLDDGVERWTGALWSTGNTNVSMVKDRLIVLGRQTRIRRWNTETGLKNVVLSTVPKAKCISWAKKLHVTYQTTAITKQAKKVTKKGRKVTWKKASATIKKYTCGKNKNWKLKTKKGKVVYRIYGKKTKSAKYTYVKQTKKTQAQVPYKYVKVKAEAVIE